MQFCLKAPEEMAAFANFMDSIDQEYRMAFSDSSGETEADLVQMNGRVPVPHAYLNIDADRNCAIADLSSRRDSRSRSLLLLFFRKEGLAYLNNARRPVSRVLSAPCGVGRPFLCDARCRAPDATNPDGEAETPPDPA